MWLVLQVPEVVQDFQVFLVEQELMVLQDHKDVMDSKVSVSRENWSSRLMEVLESSLLLHLHQYCTIVCIEYFFHASKSLINH